MPLPTGPAKTPVCSDDTRRLPFHSGLQGALVGVDPEPERATADVVPRRAELARAPLGEVVRDPERGVELGGVEGVLDLQLVPAAVEPQRLRAASRTARPRRSPSPGRAPRGGAPIRRHGHGADGDPEQRDVGHGVAERREDVAPVGNREHRGRLGLTSLDGHAQLAVATPSRMTSGVPRATPPDPSGERVPDRLVGARREDQRLPTCCLAAAVVVPRRRCRPVAGPPTSGARDPFADLGQACLGQPARRRAGPPASGPGTLLVQDPASARATLGRRTVTKRGPRRRVMLQDPGEHPRHVSTVARVPSMSVTMMGRSQTTVRPGQPASRVSARRQPARGGRSPAPGCRRTSPGREHGTGLVIQDVEHEACLHPLGPRDAAVLVHVHEGARRVVERPDVEAHDAIGDGDVGRPGLGHEAEVGDGEESVRERGLADRHLVVPVMVDRDVQPGHGQRPRPPRGPPGRAMAPGSRIRPVAHPGKGRSVVAAHGRRTSPPAVGRPGTGGPATRRSPSRPGGRSRPRRVTSVSTGEAAAGASERIVTPSRDSGVGRRQRPRPRRSRRAGPGAWTPRSRSCSSSGRRGIPPHSHGDR